MVAVLGEHVQTTLHAVIIRVIAHLRKHFYWLVILVAAAVYVGLHGLAAVPDGRRRRRAGADFRNMIDSGDWVTARLDGVAYLEKAPLIYWAMAIAYKVFGVHDWAARIPIVLSAILLAWLTAAFGTWAFGRRAGMYSGLVIATCFGLWLFTRILIPDVMLTASVALSMWAFLRAIDEDEPHPRRWAFTLAASLGTSLLFKSLVGVVFPVAAGLIYLAVTRQTFQLKIWKRIRPLSGTLVILLIAAPWHVLAAIRNPPIFDFTMHSAPGEYHGFLWFFFINEQLLRFLNLRYPRDYNTVPRAVVLAVPPGLAVSVERLFPGGSQVFLPPHGSRRQDAIAGVVLAGFILVFFTFSTTQEYYSMPCYPALALLLGRQWPPSGAWIRRGNRVLFGHSAASPASRARAVVPGPRSSRARRYFDCSQPESVGLHALSGPHGGSHHQELRLSARAVAAGGAWRS